MDELNVNWRFTPGESIPITLSFLQNGLSEVDFSWAGRVNPAGSGRGDPVVGDTGGGDRRSALRSPARSAETLALKEKFRRSPGWPGRRRGRGMGFAPFRWHRFRVNWLLRERIRADTAARHKAENLLPILAAAAERPRPASNAGLIPSGLAGPVHTLRRRRREAAGAPVVRFYSAAMVTLERARWARWDNVAPLAE